MANLPEVSEWDVFRVGSGQGRGRSLDEAHAVCSFSDPYIGLDAGYVQVTHLNGSGPVLLVVPDGKTPFDNPLLSDPTPRSQTFEGFYEWLVHSRAYTENEWKSAEPWNPATSTMLGAGETCAYGVRLLVSPEICEIEKTLAENDRPVAVGIPGYVLPMDLDARLFLDYPKRATQFRVEPRGAIAIAEHPPSETPSGWHAYTLRGKSWAAS